MPTFSSTIVSSQLTHAAVVLGCIGAGIGVLGLAGLAAMFHKAGRSPWWVLVPVANVVVQLRVIHRSLGWLAAVVLAPLLVVGAISTHNVPFVIASLVTGGLVGLLYAVMVARGTAFAFGHGPLTALGVFLLPWLFFAILGFGPAPYIYGGQRRRVAETAPGTASFSYTTTGRSARYRGHDISGAGAYDYGFGTPDDLPGQPRATSGLPALFADVEPPAGPVDPGPVDAGPVAGTTTTATPSATPPATVVTTATPPAVGWHPDPAHAGGGVMAYWDGTTFTERVTWNGSEWVPAP